MEYIVRVCVCARARINFYRNLFKWNANAVHKNVNCLSAETANGIFCIILYCVFLVPSLVIIVDYYCALKIEVSGGKSFFFASHAIFNGQLHSHIVRCQSIYKFITIKLAPNGGLFFVNSSTFFLHPAMHLSIVSLC